MSTGKFWDEFDMEPKRKFRWILYFAGMPQYIAKSVTKPSFNVAASTHNFLQHTFNFPGRVTWQDISISIVDPIQPDSAQSMYNIIAEAGYVIPSAIQTAGDGGAGFGTISKEKMITSLGEKIRIEQIGPDSSADVLESWTIHNPMITSVAFDGLDYTGDDLLAIQIGLKYDWATLNEDATTNPVGWQATGTDTEQ